MKRLRERDRERETYSEHDTRDAEDDGEESGVVNGEILRRDRRRFVWPRRRGLARIARR